jgi:hypothetical protein
LFYRFCGCDVYMLYVSINLSCDNYWYCVVDFGLEHTN